VANRFPALRSFPPPTVCWWLYGVSSHIGEVVASPATPGTCPPGSCHQRPPLLTPSPGLCRTGSLWRRAHACANSTPLALLLHSYSLSLGPQCSAVVGACPVAPRTGLRVERDSIRSHGLVPQPGGCTPARPPPILPLSPQSSSSPLVAMLERRTTSLGSLTHRAPAFAQGEVAIGCVHRSTLRARTLWWAYGMR